MKYQLSKLKMSKNLLHKWTRKTFQQFPFVKRLLNFMIQKWDFRWQKEWELCLWHNVQFSSREELKILFSFCKECKLFCLYFRLSVMRQWLRNEKQQDNSRGIIIIITPMFKKTGDICGDIWHSGDICENLIVWGPE